MTGQDFTADDERRFEDYMDALADTLAHEQRIASLNSYYTDPSMGTAARLLWCTDAGDGVLPWFLDHQAAQTDSGRSSMRLRMLTTMRVSVCCAGRLWERKVSPTMRLYRLIAPSAPALTL